MFLKYRGWQHGMLQTTKVWMTRRSGLGVGSRQEITAEIICKRFFDGRLEDEEFRGWSATRMTKLPTRCNWLYELLRTGLRLLSFAG
jgi:hypothetical protein